MAAKPLLHPPWPLTLGQQGSFLKLVVALLALLAAPTASMGPGPAGIKKVDWNAAVRNGGGEQRQYFLLHMHAPKTAGSTFYMHSVKSIPSLRPCRHIPTAFMQPVNTMEALQSNLLSAMSSASCDFVTFEGGPWIKSLIPEEYKTRVLEIVFLRDPLMRVISGLTHCQRHYGKDPHTTILMAASGRPYSFYNLTDFQTQFMQCGMVTPFKNAFSTFAPCDYTLAKAKRELTANTFFVGLAGPYYRASLCLLDYQLGLFDHSKCGDLCASQGQSAPNINSLPSHVAMESMYSVHELKWLAAANEMDSVLYGFAQQLVLKRIRDVEAEMGAKLLCF